MKKLKQLIREVTPILLILAAWFIITSLFGWTDKWLSHVKNPYVIEALVLLAIVAIPLLDGWGDKQK